MQIVSDGALDLSTEQQAGIALHLAPLVLTLDGKSYRSGIDINPAQFYELLCTTDSMPTTSQPSAGDFAEIYRKLAASEPDILSIHVSSGLSGTINAARTGASLVPEANITIVDSKTLSGAQGWQVEAAGRAINKEWSKEQIIDLLTRVGNVTDTLYTLPTLKYLIHGGRISHLKGLAASLLNIKPIIGVDKSEGKYAQRGQVRTINKAITQLAEMITNQYTKGTALRAQVMHANNEEGAALLRNSLNNLFECTWLPTTSIAPVLGAHTGPGLVGLVYAPLSQYPQVP